MGSIIDVKYETLTGLEEKSLGELGSEVNLLYRESVNIGNIALTMMAQAGQRLIVIKDRLQHGEFEEWCDKNLDFSKSKAEKMMKFARKVTDENSLFSKTETFTDIGISRVWALLSAPEEVAAEVIETNDVESMTVRELKAELARVKEEKEKAERKADAIDRNNDSIREELASVQRQLSEAVSEKEFDEMLAAAQSQKENLTKELNEAKAEKAAIQEKLEKAKADIKKAKESAKKVTEEKDAAISKAVEDLKKQQEEAVQKAVSEKIAEETARLHKDLAAADAEIEKLQKKLENNNSEDFAIFKVQTKILQEAFAQMLTCIDNIGEQDPEKAEKMRAAASKMMSILSDRL